MPKLLKSISLLFRAPYHSLHSLHDAFTQLLPCRHRACITRVLSLVLARRLLHTTLRLLSRFLHSFHRAAALHPPLPPRPQLFRFLISRLELSDPCFSLLLRNALRNGQVEFLPLLSVRLPVHTACYHGEDCEALSVDTGSEHSVRPLAVAGADGARGPYERRACQDAAEGDQRFFFQASGELLQAVLLVELSAAERLVRSTRRFWT